MRFYLIRKFYNQIDSISIKIYILVQAIRLHLHIVPYDLN